MMTRCEADVVRAAALLGEAVRALGARYADFERAHAECCEAGRAYDAALKRMLDEKAIAETDLRAAVAAIEAARGSNGGKNE
jgi:hypothetical protein